MDSGLLAALATAAAVLVAVLCVALVVLVVRSRSDRRRLEDSLAASREELAAVQRRLDTLARQVEPRPVTDGAEYVITTAGERDRLDAPTPAPYEPLTAGRFASVALGESLVRIVSLGYGVRRALSAENRNRIGFEMRREVRRSRKQRKEELKAARRHLRTTAGEEAAA